MALKQTNETPDQRTGNSQQVIYQILGFDRPSFVSDVTNAVPVKNSCRITSMSFEGDGIQVNGQLILEVVDQQLLTHIENQLQSVRGLVRVTQTKKVRIGSRESIKGLNPYARAFFLIWGVMVLALIGLRTNPSEEQKTVQTSPLKTSLSSELTSVHLLQNYWKK
ncbi:hypothetical protein IC229_16640 [Spirosoma sp. BT702]|uniref:Uncharacterized protein n=1 Tax=Spirosoma profusum TaxID=2771354 RepID=A0A927ARG2_9BACT|nr:hypothetical protein [Spirosoma profusum]MBD2702283.1 hypothetical protein [Spirosoma profusum]